MGLFNMLNIKNSLLACLLQRKEVFLPAIRMPLLCALLLLVFASPALATTYRWVDAQGKVHYGDVMPSQSTGLGHQELDKQGRVIKETPRTLLTPEERRHRAEEVAAREEHLRRVEEQQKFDNDLAEILTHSPSDRRAAAMLPALRLLQAAKGWLPPGGLELVAERLGTTREKAYEVATFYVMFFTKKPGKYVLDVCTNLSCSLRGAEKLLVMLEHKLGIKAGTANERFTLRETECLASCGTGPCLQVNEDHHESLTTAKLDALVARLS